MKDVIDLIGDEEILRHILFDEPVVLVPGEMLDVGEVAGDEIVDRDDAMPFREQAIGQMGTEKSGAAGDNGDGLFGGARGHGAYLNATNRAWRAETNCDLSVEVLEEQVGFDFPADRRFLRRRKTGGFLMCRNIKRLHDFQPPATDEEIRASALQYVRKLSGFVRPSKANEEASPAPSMK